MKKALVTIFWIMLLLFTYINPASADNNSLAFCPSWGEVTSIQLTDPQGGLKTELTQTQINTMSQWQPLQDFWKPTGLYGVWNVPYDTKEMWRLNVRTLTSDRTIFVELSETQPENAYLFVYNSLTIGGTPQGLHDFCKDFKGAAGHFVIPSSALLAILPAPVCPNPLFVSDPNYHG